ncbi:MULTISPECIES: hypothetical protein [Halomonas]|uniref:Uncharacterized protein n=1 Tax=Halomonas halophila TaxID=29573 RepID=A0ABQ0TZB9_9GAMM|nr:MULTISPECIES: hypothetical protein [Halomonas]MDR5889629.1 hypothetical protein [Halomonas salina]WJY06311.1 hypothetical protein QWG60_11395 [Halomonas halophila]GEK71602.1 hypothetical protein HHA04nite_01460 [Halomonas halophila]
MAYTSFAPVDIDELLSQIDSFASGQLGWGSSYSGGVLTLTPIASGTEFDLYEAAGYGAADNGQWIYIDMRDPNDATNQVAAAMSHISSTSLAWLYGGNTTEPWLLITVLTEPGVYRHAFVGYLAKYGTWAGGAVCSAINWSHRTTSTPATYTNASNRLLFSFVSSYGAINNELGKTGGVLLDGVHGDRPRALFASASTYTSGGHDYDATHPRAGGGYRDDYAERVRDPGVMPLSGEAALVPITLFADMLRNDTWTPIGHVPGLRMVNVANLDPEQAYTYAGLTWKIFPLCRKADATDDFGTADLGIAVLQEA